MREVCLRDCVSRGRGVTDGILYQNTGSNNRHNRFPSNKPASMRRRRTRNAHTVKASARRKSTSRLLSIPTRTYVTGESIQGEVPGPAICTFADGGTLSGCFSCKDEMLAVSGPATYTEVGRCWVYTGALVEGRLHGNGTLQTKMSSFKGAFVDGLPDGKGVLTRKRRQYDGEGEADSHKVREIKGTWRRGKLQSSQAVSLCFLDGTRYFGTWTRAPGGAIVPHGSGVFQYGEGLLFSNVAQRWTIDFCSGLKSGCDEDREIALFELPPMPGGTRTTYRGNVLDCLPCGAGSMLAMHSPTTTTTLAEGTESEKSTVQKMSWKYTGDWRGGAPNGLGQLVQTRVGESSTTVTWTGEFACGLPDGLGQLRVTAGRVSERVYTGCWRSTLTDGLMLVSLVDIAVVVDGECRGLIRK